MSHNHKKEKNPNWKNGIKINNPKKYYQERYLKNKEKKILAYLKDKKENPEKYKEKAKKYYQKYREKIIEKSKLRQKTEKGKKYKREYNKKPENRMKETIRTKTRRIKKKKGICNKCGNKIETQFHHISFNPNISEELCYKCHLKKHGRKLL